MKIGDFFSNLVGIKYTKFYSNLFRFDIFIVQCLGGYFFWTQCSTWKAIQIPKPIDFGFLTKTGSTLKNPKKPRYAKKNLQKFTWLVF